MYKIVCKDLTIPLCYVGHTTNFIKRKQQHKEACNNINNKEYNTFKYVEIRNNGGWDNWIMIEVEKFSCNDFNEACKREREIIELLNAQLNMVLPTRTQTEYKEVNKEKYKQYYKDYRILNKDKKQQQGKEYYEKNRDEKIEYSKNYAKENKDKLEYRKESIKCICGSNYIYNHKARHEKAQKHQTYLLTHQNI
jgi:hypothetical protein